MPRTSALSDASSGQQLGPQISFWMKPAGNRCLKQGESVEQQAVGVRAVDVQYLRAEAVSFAGKNGCDAEFRGPSGSGVRSRSCGHQDV